MASKGALRVSRSAADAPRLAHPAVVQPSCRSPPAEAHAARSPIAVTDPAHNARAVVNRIVEPTQAVVIAPVENGTPIVVGPTPIHVADERVLTRGPQGCSALSTW